MQRRHFLNLLGAGAIAQACNPLDDECMRVSKVMQHWAKTSGITWDTNYLAFEAYMAGIADPIPDAYKVPYNNVFTTLKTTKGRDLTTSIWDSLEYIRIQSTYSKNAALVDLKNLVVATITNDHGASFTTNVGLKGNGTNFRVNTGFNPSTAVKWGQNDATAGVLVLDDTVPGGTNQEFGLFDAGGTNGTFIMAKRSSTQKSDFNGCVNGAFDLSGASSPGNASPTVIKGKGYYSVQRGASGSYLMFQNSRRVTDTFASFSSNTLINGNMPEFCALNIPSTFSAFSSNTHGAIWFGNFNIEPNLIVKILQGQWYSFIASGAAYFNNQITFIGDSMTGDVVQANTAASLISRYPTKVVTDLGANWVGQIVAKGNREIFADNTVASLYTRYNEVVDGYIVPGSPTNQLSFRCDAFAKDVLVFWMATNDIAYHTYSNGQVKGYLDTKLNLLKAQGYKIIVVGIIDRKATYLGGQNQAGFDLLRADFNNGYLADFPTAVSTHIYSGGSQADFFINPYGDARFQNANDTGYFQADKIHPNGTGFDLLGTYVTTAANLL